jgi:hypothetical protein
MWVFRDLISIPIRKLNFDVFAAVRHALARQSALVPEGGSEVELVLFFVNRLGGRVESFVDVYVARRACDDPTADVVNLDARGEQQRQQAARLAFFVREVFRIHIDHQPRVFQSQLVGFLWGRRCVCIDESVSVYTVS